MAEVSTSEQFRTRSLQAYGLKKKTAKDFIMSYTVSVYSCIRNKCCKETTTEHDKLCMTSHRKGVMVSTRAEEKRAPINEQRNNTNRREQNYNS